MKVDKFGNKEFLDDGTTPNPEFQADQVGDPAGGGANNKDTEDLINRMVEERLSKIKLSLDKAYQENKIEDKPEAGPKPNETGGFYFSSFLKITDPNTKEVLVETRGDN